MKASFENYTRLAKSLSGMSSLWKADDHLVYVRGSGILLPFTEEYKRYRFQDIQVISVAKKSRLGMAVMYAMAMVVFVMPILLIFTLADSFGTATAVAVSVFSVGFLLFASLFTRHLVLGPTCTCDIQTSMSRDRIRPLNRYFQTMEVIDSMDDDFRVLQEPLLVEGGNKEVLETRRAHSNVMAALAVPMVAMPTFVAVMLFSLGCIAALHLESIALCGVLLVTILLVSILLLLALISSVRSATPESIRAVLWILMGLMFLFIGTSIVYLLIAVTRDPAYTLGITGPLEAFAGVATEGGLVFYLGFIVLSIGVFVSGLIGLIQCGKWRRKIAESANREPAEGGPEDG